MLLANRYDDRTHFIFELLQNTEDALAKRREWKGSREVTFSLSPDALSVTHFGKLFDEEDVRGICGIGESTKGLTSIGRFGIGFKSVYAFTDSPEIHSGSDHFAIDSFVWPRAIKAIDLPQDGTVIHLPLRSDDSTAVDQILSGLQRLRPRTLLFLREITEISWSVVGGASGMYLRDEPKALGSAARQVMVIGQDDTTDDVEEEQWIIFSRAVSNNGEEVGQVEIAFALEEGDGGSSLQRLADSPLVVFFPTVLSTNLGFLVQGPYRTTPSRDNVPQSDPWNQYLVEETSALLVDALRELRRLGLLNVSVLRCLPLDASRFTDGSRFAPLFSAVRETLLKESLIPRYKNGHVAAQRAKLARTQDLRTLISPEQLTDLFQSDHGLVWLSDDITVDRTPDVRTYLIEELGVHEITPEWLLPRLTKAFLEAQSDEWIEKLYVFLNSQGALLRRLRGIPLVRLEDGSHIVSHSRNQPQAFLPIEARTGFPTVRRSVCQSEDSLAFLKSLGLSPPDPVDDVIANILPKYSQDHQNNPGPDYRSDIERILAAFATDSTARRQKLASALREVRFVWAMDTGDGSHHFVRPPDAYQATQRMKELFLGVHGVLIVDDSEICLRGERIRALLEAAGSSLYLVRSSVESTLTTDEKADLRRAVGIQEITTEIAVRDWTLRGLKPLLEKIEMLAEDESAARATLLWNALCDVGNRRGQWTFQGEYIWKRFSERRAVFDASFVRLLNETAWVPDENGVLKRPGDVVFEGTGWEPNPLLLTKIRFKPPIIDQLAREAGIEPGVLALLSQYHLNTVEQFMTQLRRAGFIDDKNSTEAVPTKSTSAVSVAGTGSQPSGLEDRPAGDSGNEPQGVSQGDHERLEDGGVQSRTKQDARSRAGYEFIPYVAVNAENENESDPDNLTQQERMDLEEEAIGLILRHEPGLKRTPPNNPGFDLMEPGPDGQPTKWVEVKAMKKTLQDRPVGISRTQFQYAQKHGKDFWLYIVENAGDPEQAHVLPIRDPAGKTQTFSFDYGWILMGEDAWPNTHPTSREQD